MKSDNVRKDRLQELCRGYLGKLRYMADKHGLGGWLADIIRANKHDECEATEKEVVMLSRLVGDECVNRKDIPQMLSKSYRRCVKDGDYEKIKRVSNTGTYSKVSALLRAAGVKI